MELYEIKEKVGSDPCLVLNYDYDGTTDGTKLYFIAKIKNVNSEAEAYKFINEYVDLIEKIANTRCIVFMGTLHTSGTLEPMNNTKLYLTNLNIVNTEHGRTMSTTASISLDGINIKQIYLVMLYDNNTGSVILEGQTSLV